MNRKIATAQLLTLLMVRLERRLHLSGVCLLVLGGIYSSSITFAATPPVKGLPIAKVKHSGPVEFEREILPVLRNNCLACHNQTKAKGGLILETPQTILKGGDSGPSVVPKKPNDSLLLKAAAHRDPELIMPPPDNKVAAVALKPEELGLLQLWIEQGAKGEVRASIPVTWQPMPAGLNAIYAVAVTRDGQFAACGRGNRISIYEVPTGRLAAQLEDAPLRAAHRDTVNSLAFSPDGTVLASGGYREVKFWRRAPVTNLVAQAAEPAGLPASAETNKLSTFVTNGELRLLNVSTQRIAMFKLHGGLRFTQAEAERELSFAKSEVDYRKAGLKTAETNQANATTRVAKSTATNAILETIFSEKQTALTNATVARDDAARALDEIDPQIKAALAKIAAAETNLTNVTTATKPGKDAPDKRKAEKLTDDLASKSNALAAARAEFDQLPAESKNQHKTANEKLTAASKALTEAEKEFKKAQSAHSTAENEMQLATRAEQKTKIALESAMTAVESAERRSAQAKETAEAARLTLEGADRAMRAVAFSPDEALLAALDEAGVVHLWNAKSGAALETIATGHNSAGWLAWSNGDTLVISSAAGGSVLNLKPSWNLSRAIGGDERSPLADRVNALRFTPDGKQLFTGGGEPTRGGEIKLWRAEDGAFVRELPNVHSDSVLALDVSADGKFLASGGADRLAKVTELASGKVLKTLEGHTHHVLGVAWKRDGRTLVTAGADNVAKVWDTTTGERRKNIEGFGKEVTAAAFVGVSDEAVLSSGDGQVALFKDKGDKIRSCAGATDYVNAVAATPDGNVIVAGGADGVLRVWNGKDGKLLAEFPPH